MTIDKLRELRDIICNNLPENDPESYSRVNPKSDKPIFVRYVYRYWIKVERKDRYSIHLIYIPELKSWESNVMNDKDIREKSDKYLMFPSHELLEMFKDMIGDRDE